LQKLYKFKRRSKDCRLSVAYLRFKYVSRLLTTGAGRQWRLAMPPLVSGADGLIEAAAEHKDKNNDDDYDPNKIVISIADTANKI
jgi:hypothetical protein